VAFVGALGGCFSEETRESPAANTRACSRLQGAPATDCGVCHERAYAQWSRTTHASAWVNPRFRAEFDPAPSQSCIDCHADARILEGSPDEGVSCSSCHVPMTAATSAGMDWPAGVQMCARCHQFNFPEPAPGQLARYDPAEPQQDTVSEWAQGALQTCVSCHMSGHEVLGLDDPAFVQRAVETSAIVQEIEGVASATVTVEPAWVGHRVPTGDMFRTLRVQVSLPSGWSASAWAGRTFGSQVSDDGERFLLRTVLDDRIPAPGESDTARVFRFPLPNGTTEVQWSLDLFRRAPQSCERLQGCDPEDLPVHLDHGTASLLAGPRAWSFSSFFTPGWSLRRVQAPRHEHPSAGPPRSPRRPVVHGRPRSARSREP